MGETGYMQPFFSTPEISLPGPRDFYPGVWRNRCVQPFATLHHLCFCSRREEGGEKRRR